MTNFQQIAPNIQFVDPKTGLLTRDGFQVLQGVNPTSFTPGLTFGGGSTGMTFTTRMGSYIRQGHLWIIQFNVILSAKGSSTGSALFTGLPATVSNGFGGLHSYNNFALVTGAIILDPLTGTKTFGFKESRGTFSSANLDDTYFTDTTTFTGMVIIRDA